MENIKDIEGRMQKSVDNLKEEYVTIRAQLITQVSFVSSEAI